MFSKIKLILVAIIIICIFLFGLMIGKYIFPSPKNPEFKTKFDQTVIVQKIQNLSRIEVLEMVLQRDLEVQLDLGNMDLFGLTIEKKRTQKVALTGKVVAGVDLSTMTKDKIIFDSNNNLTITVPSPKILYVKIDSEKTQTTRDDLTLLYKLENISDQKRLELNEILRRQLSMQSDQALLEGACKDKILNKATESTKQAISRLFAFAPINKLEIIVEPTVEECFVVKETL